MSEGETGWVEVVCAHCDGEGCCFCDKKGSVLVRPPATKCPHCEGEGCYYCGYSGWHRPKSKYD